MQNLVKAIFCIDVSPSMGYKLNGTKSFLEKLNEAYNEYFLNAVEQCQTKEVQVYFITYGSTAKAVSRAFQTIRCTNQKEKEQQKINFEAEKSGSSNLADAFRLIGEMNSDKMFDGANVIVISDGDPDETCAKELIEKNRNLLIDKMQLRMYLVDGNDKRTVFSTNYSEVHFPYTDDPFRTMFDGEILKALSIREIISI